MDGKLTSLVGLVSVSALLEILLQKAERHYIQHWHVHGATLHSALRQFLQ